MSPCIKWGDHGTPSRLFSTCQAQVALALGTKQETKETDQPGVVNSECWSLLGPVHMHSWLLWSGQGRRVGSDLGEGRQREEGGGWWQRPLLEEGNRDETW